MKLTGFQTMDRSITGYVPPKPILTSGFSGSTSSFRLQYAEDILSNEVELYDIDSMVTWCETTDADFWSEVHDEYSSEYLRDIEEGLRKEITLKILCLMYGSGMSEKTLLDKYGDLL